MDAWRLQYPYFLLLIVPVVLLFLWALRRGSGQAVLYSSVHILKTLPVTWALRLKRLLPWLRLAGLLLIVAALAGPQHGLSEFRIRTEGIAIQMCIDRSGSMEAMDFQLDGQQVDRLTAVKSVFRDFVTGKGDLPGRPDDVIGLVAFGGFAEGLTPLTLDHGAVVQVLDTIEIPQPVTDSRGRQIKDNRLVSEERATAIGDAIAMAVERLKDAAAKSKVIVLLSDGSSNAGVVTPDEAAEAARAFGIKVYTIGVGTTGMAPFPTVDLFGRHVLQSRPVELDEETLRRVAQTTSGMYFNAQDTQALESVYAAIDRLEKTETEGKLYTEYRELFPWFLIPGLMLIVTEILLVNTRFRSLP